MFGRNDRNPDFLPVDEFQPRGRVAKLFARIRNTYLLVSVISFLLMKLLQIRLEKMRSRGRGSNSARTRRERGTHPESDGH